jgi:hypothetical protein
MIARKTTTSAVTSLESYLPFGVYATNAESPLNSSSLAFVRNDIQLSPLFDVCYGDAAIP